MNIDKTWRRKGREEETSWVKGAGANTRVCTVRALSNPYLYIFIAYYYARNIVRVPLTKTKSAPPKINVCNRPWREEEGGHKNHTTEVKGRAKSLNMISF